MDDWYRVLEVNATADRRTIDAAYERLSNKYRAEPGSADRLAEVERAYAVLGDPARRRAYDQSRIRRGTRRDAPAAATSRRLRLGRGMWLAIAAGVLGVGAIAGVVLALTLSDGDGGKASPASPGATAAPTSKPLTAAELMPLFDDYDRTEPEKIPAPGGQPDIAFSVFKVPNATTMTARVETRVYPDDQIAATDYKAQAAGWKTPPAELLGANLKNAEGPRLTVIPESTSYRSQTRDQGGNRVYTDVYRIGRVIVIQLVLSPDDSGATPLRMAIANYVLQKVTGP